MAGLLIFLEIGIPVNAYKKTDTKKETQIKNIMLESNYLFEKVIERNLIKAEKEYEEIVLKKKYDYYLSMQSFYENINPYKNKDLTPLLVAYMIAKEQTDCDVNILNMDFIEMETKTILDKDNTKYMTVKLKGLNEEDIFKLFHLNQKESIKEQYYRTLKIVNKYINGNYMAQENFLYLGQSKLDKKTLEHLEWLKGQTLSPMQETLVEVSTSILNRVPYQWGGKSNKSGYHNEWFTIDENGEQRGLDCSGYIQWIFRTANAEETFWKSFSIVNSVKELIPIEKEELQIGDLGILHDGSKQVTNHIGMYLGNGQWIHCSSGQNTVVIDDLNMFTLFRRVPYMNLQMTKEIKENITAIEKKYSEEDIYLLAQLVHNEARGEGLNGWIAVAEVVKNRIESPLFKKCTTIPAVIYESGQFENVDLIKEYKPSEELIHVVREVMEGNLSVLNNKNVLMFRNANGSKEDWDIYKHFTSINNHEFYIIQ